MSLLDRFKNFLKEKPVAPPAPIYTPQAVTTVDPNLPPLTKRPKQKIVFDRNITPLRDDSNKTVIPIYTENPFGHQEASTDPLANAIIEE